ncbi:MAG: hypothetical protein ACF8Q5_12900 [Phycisphaerales bacterium JB040]
MRWAEALRGAALAGVLGIASLASAQDLDLDVPEPAPGATGVHSVVADALREDAAMLRMTSEEREDSARAAVRELASALIERGLRRAGDGAELLIAGRTLGESVASIDGVLAGLGPMDRVALASDLRRLGATLPAEPEALDRALRDALAPLVGVVGVDSGSGWVGLDAPAPDASTLSRLVDTGPVQSAPGLLRLIEEARADPAYRPSADRLARHLAEASAALEPAGWVPDRVRAGLAQRYAEAVRQALGGNALLAVEELETLRDLAELVALLGELPATEDTELARVHAERLILTPGTDARDKLDAGLRVARLATGQNPGEPPQSFVRDLRPGWATLLQQGEEKRAALVPLIGAALRDGNTTDPGALATLLAARRVPERFGHLSALNAWLKQGLGEDSAPVAHRDHRLLGERAGRMLREDNTNVWAMGAEAQRFAALPAEPIWRDPATPVSGWIETIDSLVPELGPAADRLRREWEDAWATDGEAGPATVELDAGVRLLRLLEGVGDARRYDRQGWALAGWPGWHHDRGDALYDGLVADLEPLALLVAAWTDPLTEIDENDLRSAERSFAAVCAATRLERLLRDAGRQPTDASARGVITQLGLGSPDPCLDPLAPHRADIAELNRRVLEALALDGDQHQAALDYANDMGLRVLDRLGR